MRVLRFIWPLLLLAAFVLPDISVRAKSQAPAETATDIRTALFDAQLALGDDPALASQRLAEAQAAYSGGFSSTIKTIAPGIDARIRAGFDAAARSLAQKDVPSFAAARAQIWTAILAASQAVVENALKQGDSSTALLWLSVREFRHLTRFSRPSVDATVAINSFSKDETSLEDALLAFHADLLDTYQARLNESLRDLADTNTNGFPARRAELAASAEGYFLILSPAYREQRGVEALQNATAAFAGLRAGVLSDKDLDPAMQQVAESLHNFRAAPLSPADKSRRAGQLIRYVSLVPVEYKRGVTDGRIIRELEIQEAITFHAGAYAAFSDLENLLDALNREKTSQAKTLFDALGKQLAEAGKQTAVADPNEIQYQANTLTGLLKEIIPEEWIRGSSQGDFDVIASLLEQMEVAFKSGEYDQAESARLEAYSVLESGPEAKLTAFEPQLKIRLDDLFWNGQGKNKGLAYLIKNRAGIQDLQSTRTELASTLSDTQALLGRTSSPGAVAANAGLIVFREGLEAVLILASLMSSMKRPEERKYRKPMWIGTLIAALATVLTWILAHAILQALAGYQEALTASVSLIAIGVLLVILNWFFHKQYWTSWIANFHSKKQQLISGEAGLWLGLITLGFTSVYREGLETVLFLQAFILESGMTIVLTGVAIALLAVVMIGIIIFRLQVNLPYRNMLIITGVLVGGVLLQMVGNTVHIMQIIGWLSIHPIESLSVPYWFGTWFGIYPTWEGISLQILSATYVIGSYYMAEYLQKRKIPLKEAV